MNGDDVLSALDVLMVVNELNNPGQSSLAQLTATNFVVGTPVPEPATWLLAACGFAGLLAARRVTCRPKQPATPA